MSSTDSNADEATLENIDLVGNKRRQNLRSAGYVNVGDVAEAEPAELFDELSSASTSDVQKIINNARAMVGHEEKAEAPTEHNGMKMRPDDGTGPTKADVDVPEKYQADDEDVEGDGGGAVVEEMGVDEFVDSGPDPLPKPEECENVLIIAGDDAFDVDGPYGDLDAEGQAGLVQRRLMEFGFEPEKIGALGQGMGRVAVNSWVKYTAHETDRELPGRVQITVDDDVDYPKKEDYQKRNEAALEWADGVCVVANGNYVGMWVNMAREENVLIRTPAMEDDE